MDNFRILLWGALAALVWMNVITWQRDYAPPPLSAPVATQSSGAKSASPANDLPTLPNEAQSSHGPTAPVASSTTEQQAPSVDVLTDVLHMQISTRGGELDRADLLKYPQVKNRPDIPVQLFTPTPPDLFVARSGLRATGDAPSPTHQALFTADDSKYELQPGQDTVEVHLTWNDPSGLSVSKVYTFHRGSYIIDLRYDVTNHGSTEWKAASYQQLVRHYVATKRSYFNVETYAFKGPAVYDGKSFRNLKMDNEEDRKFQASYTNGWMAAMQHHFVAAVVPTPGVPYDYQLKVDADNDFVLSMRSPLQTVAAGATGKFTERLFVGPKLQDQLKMAAPGLELTADYGRLTVIAQPLFWLLEKVHGLVRNWGLAIILVTFLIKLAFYKLTQTSGRSMAKMRNLSPRIKAVQERYKDDREQLGRAMMELYKREKINPLAGCLPILVQVPVFMGFYWVLLESVEMRQAPFFGWITDLSSRDPYFILPVIMAGAMFFQFKLQPPSPDPMQAKVLQFMPLVMAAMMATFPAGLVLYWITNTILSIAQQWRINKVVAAEGKKSG